VGGHDEFWDVMKSDNENDVDGVILTPEEVSGRFIDREDEYNYLLINCEFEQRIKKAYLFKIYI